MDTVNITNPLLTAIISNAIESALKKKDVNLTVAIDSLQATFNGDVAVLTTKATAKIPAETLRRLL